MTVVVTGAAGFLGRVLLRELVARGHDVVAVDRRPIPAGTGALALQADLLDADPRVARALAAAEGVWHLAACPGVRDTAPDVEIRRRRDNVEATRRVCAAVPPDVPLVVTSSSSVYGGARAGRPSREDDPLRPVGGYARSKAAGEGVCAERLAAGGRVLVARPFTLVGERQRPDMALHRWVAAARAGRPLTVLGALSRTRDFTDVRWAARALADLATAPAGTVNVGSGRPRPLAEAVAAIGTVLGTVPLVEVRPALVEEVADTWADTSRVSALVGPPPETDLLDVVARVAGLPAATGALAEVAG